MPNVGKLYIFSVLVINQLQKNNTKTCNHPKKHLAFGFGDHLVRPQGHQGKTCPERWSPLNGHLFFVTSFFLPAGGNTKKLFLDFRGTDVVR